MKEAVVEEEDSRQVEDLELPGQGHVALRIHFKGQPLGVPMGHLLKNPLEMPTGRTGGRGKQDDRRRFIFRNAVVEIELVELWEHASGE